MCEGERERERERERETLNINFLLDKYYDLLMDHS